jgi:hypothetical protein
MAEPSRISAQVKQAAETTAHETAETARRLTEAHGEVTEAIAEHGSRAIDAVNRAGEIYRDATGAHSEDMAALLSSYSVVAKGLQEIQHVWIDALQKTLQRSVQAPQRLRWSNFSEIAQSHRDMLRENMGNLLEANARVLRIAGKTAEEAARPIEGRAKS